VNRNQLEHVLRAATDIVPGADIVIIGSQSILAARDETDLPIEATRSIEVDLAFVDDPDEVKADAVDGAIGELSRFHETFGYYAQGVSVGTAVVPEGWRERLVEVASPQPGTRVRALEPHDCVVSKLVADREKDREFATALIGAGIVDAVTLRARVDRLPDSVHTAKRLRLATWIERRIRADG
jgi:hypothetical protein